MMVVAVEAGPGFQAGAPQLLFTGNFEQEIPDEGAANYDVSGDGQRFLILAETVDEAPPQIHVVLSWHQELLERVPVP